MKLNGVFIYACYEHTHTKKGLKYLVLKCERKRRPLSSCANLVKVTRIFLAIATNLPLTDNKVDNENHKL